jgi:hypothetical protein
MNTRINTPMTEISEYNEMSKSVATLIGKNPRFEFSIIQSHNSDNGFYVKHPNLNSMEPVIEGKVQLGTDYWRVNEKNAVTTPVLENPTWKDILIATNNLLEENDAGGIFLEFLTIKNEVSGIKQVELEFGS